MTELHLPASETKSGSSLLGSSVSFANLTIDNPDDADWYQFQLNDTDAVLSVQSVSENDGMTLTLYTGAAENVGTAMPVATIPDQLDRAPVPNDSPDHAFEIPDIEDVAVIRGLSLDDPNAEDWYRFELTYDNPATFTAPNLAINTYQLTGNAQFTIAIGDEAPTEVTLFQLATQGLSPNASIDDLVDDLNDALDVAGLGDQIVADTFGKRIRLSLRQQGSDASFELNVPAGPANELGFETGSVTVKPEASMRLKRLGNNALTMSLYDALGQPIPATEYDVVDDFMEIQELVLDGLPIGEYLLEVSGGAGRYELRPSIGTPSNGALDYTGAGEATLDLSSLTTETTYLVQVTSDKVPTVYDLTFEFAGVSASAVSMAARNDLVRRDIGLGGAGNDRISGGDSEDWILGGDGDDVLEGGTDRLASDLLFGEDGDDTFQLIPDRLPFLQGTTETYIPTLVDRFDGGDGDDRVMFLGGDRDQLGRPVPDEVAIRYNRILHRYEFTSLIWDTANQQFVVDDMLLFGSADGSLDPTDERLVFSLIVDGGSPIEVTVDNNATSPQEMVDAINEQLVFAGIADQVQAGRLGDTIGFQRVSPGRNASIDIVGINDVAGRVLHLADSQKTHSLNRRFEQTYLFYQTQGVERTVIATRDGNDVVHASPEFVFQNTTSEWGIDPGDFEQRGLLTRLEILGGDGADILFGGAEADRIDGGAGDDFIYGHEGDDWLIGGGGNDLVVGEDANGGPILPSRSLRSRGSRRSLRDE